ncbi:PAS domain S-box protein [Pseudomonas oryzihabitans]|uniref:PAS domain S-box protein n=1 Tax=Pseudomonas oryzihabitans TaxID=47885 RepID=UPI00289450D0|nr:PAS domain S-box protein [Pseudomonas oryzihabitans]MDT3723237.1 PAS domain S-box protein [Pseudomonas oryzihabitans]
MSESNVQSMPRKWLEREVIRLRGKGHHSGLDTLRKLAIFDSALDFAMIVTDPTGIVTDWNIGAERILHWTAQEMRGQDASRFFTPEDRANDRVEVEMQTALREGRAADVRWHLRKGGERFWASGEMMPLLDEQEGHIGFVKILRDRTEEHLAQTAKRQREKQRRALLTLSDQFDHHAQDAKVLINAACEILGETLEVHLVGYGLVDPEVESITVERDWTRGSSPSIAGTLYFRDYGSYIEDLKRGEMVVVCDARTDLRTAAYASALEQHGARAFVNTPLFEDGHFVALLYVSTNEPRDWSESELHFIREVAARTRAATARRLAEQALRVSEHRLAALIQASSEVRFRVSADWSKLYELSGAGFVSDTTGSSDTWLTSYIPPQDQPRVREEIARAIHSKSPYVLEHQVNRMDGTVGWASTRAVPLLDTHGAIIEWYGAAANITEQRHAELALRTLNTTLEQRVEARTAERNRIWQVSRDMLLVSDLAGVWLAVNPAWTTCLGWDEDELLGTTSAWLEHPEDQPLTRQEIQQVAKGNPTTLFENRLRTRAGDYRTLAWTAVCSGDKIYAVARDVTDERVQAAALAVTEEALRQAQKMEAVGQLTGGIAHDFNNLLAGISGGLELLSIRVDQGRFNDLDRYISAAQGAAQRAAALTHRLLAFSRRQPLKSKPVDANEHIQGLLELLTRTVGPAIEVKTVLGHDLWPVEVDPSQLENTLLNLCINARDAMPDGGFITITTANRFVAQAEAKRDDIPTGDYLTVSVTDTGTGMTPEVMAKVFDPFFTTKPIGQGTGLGLSMIYGFAKQSNGQVRICSEVGFGTTVTLYLPRYTGELDQQVEQARPQGLRPAVEGETVLVVEDEPTVRLLITEVLDDLGYVAIEAGDGAGGLAVLQSDARVDLLITDVGLPGSLNGRQVADAGRVSRPGLKVLFITGYVDVPFSKQEEVPDGMAVLIKPFSFDSLTSRLREMLENKGDTTPTG